jgi:hypothetical protein
MKKTVLFLMIVSILLPSIGTKAQESNIYHRVNLKLGHSETPSFLNWEKNYDMGNVRVEGNYGITSFVEGGVYLGYDKFWNSEKPSIDFDNPDPQFLATRYQSDALFYGLNANFQIMPLFIKDRRVRIDLFFSGKIGAISMLALEGSLYKGTAFDYGAYAGIAYFITKSWGLHIEYGFNKKVKLPEMEPCLRYGLSIKF